MGKKTLNEHPPLHAQSETMDLQEQILTFLPPQVADIIRNYLREILSGIAIVVLVSIIGIGYSIYTTRQENSAAAELGIAMANTDMDDRAHALKTLIKKYRHTDAANQALLLLGAAEKNLRDVSAAEDAFRRAREVFPKDSVCRASATMGLAYMNEEHGKLQDAQALFREAGSGETGYEAVALLDLARVSAALGKRKQALDAYNEFLGQRPESQDVDYVRFKISELSR